MQTEEFEIVDKLKRKNHLLIMINSVLLTICTILIFLISCRTHTEDYIHYTVQSGDTLFSISQISGVPVDKIKSFNDLESDLIKTGQSLNLPGITSLKKGNLMQELLIIPREQWGAKKPGHLDSATKFTRITVHHTTDNAKFDKTDLEFLRLIQKHHQKTNKWADIGYHFLIGHDGMIYQGRNLEFTGAHVRGKNEGNIGIALLGDYNRDQLHPSQLRSLQKLLNALRERFDISSKNVFGHGELGDTKCPGKNTLKYLNEYRKNS